MWSFLLIVLLTGCGPGHGEDIGAEGDTTCASGDEPPLTANFTDGLVADGCRYLFAAVDSAGTVLIHLDVPVFADASAGSSVSAGYTLPDESVRLDVFVGCGLQQGECGDEGSASVSRFYTPTSGLVSVDLTNDGEEADATVEFLDVNLMDRSGETVVVSALWDVRMYMGL